MSSPLGYSRLQIALHWLVAIMIAAQYLLKDSIAKAWDGFVAGSPVAFNPLVALHVFGGIAIGLFVLWRLVLRFSRGVPKAPEEEHAALKLIAHAVHWAFYLVILALVVSGGLSWFGGVVPAANAHNVLKVALLALIVLHVVGALFHQLILKSGVMTRMLRPAT